jgi:hypothetical protein
MSSNKYAGGLSALLAEKAREKAREQAAESAPQAPSAQETPSASQAPSASPAPSAPGTIEVVPGAPGAREALGAGQTLSAPLTLPGARLEVDPVPGYLQLSNTLVDGILARLDPYEQSVYLRLYRLSHGNQRDTCTVSYDVLAQRTSVSRRQCFRAIERLEALGLIERVPVVGRARGGATLYRVAEVPIVGRRGSAQQAPDATQARGDQQAPGAHRAHMKDFMKDKEKKAHVAAAPAPESLSVYDVRKIAARFRELHHGESDYTKDRLRADVRTALIGEGRESDDRLIDEAIG